MSRRTRLFAAAAAFLAMVTAGMVAAPPAEAHFFARFGFGFPVFLAPPPPPPPVYVVPRVAYIPPPPVYPYRYGYRYRRVVVRHYRHYRRVHHQVRHHWCSCRCCR